MKKEEIKLEEEVQEKINEPKKESLEENLEKLETKVRFLKQLDATNENANSFCFNSGDIDFLVPLKREHSQDLSFEVINYNFLKNINAYSSVQRNIKTEIIIVNNKIFEPSVLEDILHNKLIVMRYDSQGNTEGRTAKKTIFIDKNGLKDLTGILNYQGNLETRLDYLSMLQAANKNRCLIHGVVAPKGQRNYVANAFSSDVVSIISKDNLVSFFDNIPEHDMAGYTIQKGSTFFELTFPELSFKAMDVIFNAGITFNYNVKGEGNMSVSVKAENSTYPIFIHDLGGKLSDFDYRTIKAAVLLFEEKLKSLNSISNNDSPFKSKPASILSEMGIKGYAGKKKCGIIEEMFSESSTIDDIIFSVTKIPDLFIGEESMVNFSKLPVIQKALGQFVLRLPELIK